MSGESALEMIKKALEEVSKGSSKNVTMDTDLVKENILDSLDLMNFLFELEQLNGKKIEEITETHEDFRVATLVGFLSNK